MFKPVVASVCLALALVGCSTARRGADMPDWSEAPTTNSPPILEHVAEGPQPAIPPVSLPEPFKPRPATIVDALVPVERWSRENKIGVLRELAQAPVPAYALTTGRGLLTFQAKSLLTRWNNLEVRLGFEPQMIGGQPFMHLLDLEKTIRPLLSPLEIPARTNRVIVIDPGHGGKNAGTESVLGNGNEKEFTLDWARRLGRILATNGWQVWLTRTNDTDISLSNRVSFAEERHADLFISLHFNSAAPAQEQVGVETYCLTPAGMPSTVKRGYEDDTAQAFPNNSFDEKNLQFALRAHQALVREAGLQDRGVRRARFLGVLRGQNRPAILIEGGYLSNPHEARRIADPQFRQKLADAVANALLP
ncbi:MAG: N-acetylmuramoyl-L-alanine amidase [Verrucomicrobiota bacterium]